MAMTAMRKCIRKAAILRDIKDFSRSNGTMAPSERESAPSLKERLVKSRQSLCQPAMNKRSGRPKKAYRNCSRRIFFQLVDTVSTSDDSQR